MAEIGLGSIGQSLRPVAIGRKNSLFAGSSRGGEAALVLYSLIPSCKPLGINPRVSLRDLLDRISTHPHTRIDDLTPRRSRGLRAPAQKH